MSALANRHTHTHIHTAVRRQQEKNCDTLQSLGWSFGVVNVNVPFRFTSTEKQTNRRFQNERMTKNSDQKLMRQKSSVSGV